MSSQPDDAVTLPIGTVTFLRTDVEGSMALARTLGDRWDALNGTHLGLIRAAIDANGGVCVRTEGDAVFGAFPEAGAAVDAAVEAQRALAGHDWPPGVEVRVRMGLHTGEAHLAGDDYGGFDVNRAARIAAAAHGGQIVLSEATRALTAGRLASGVVVRDLGRHALKDVPDPEQLYQLDVPGLRTDFPPLRTSSPTDGNLPLRLTSFIGRQTDLDELDRLFDTGRLVTLTGPGGIGKTSLAIELARRRSARTQDGAWFVALDTVDDPAQVASAIARTLGLFDGPDRPAAEALPRFLAERSPLLVLDNFEHLLEGASEVSTILRASPGTRIVVTSRAPLHIAGEQDYPVRSLSEDEPLDGPAVGRTDGGGVASHRLFVERARAVRPGWEPGDEAATVREICDLLDGLPLGIELAAARIALLPLGAIRDRLAAHLPLPGTASRDAPGRQRTLDGAIRWSHDLLPARQQRLLRRLAVFEGGFDLDQVPAVAATSGEATDALVDDLVALVDQSLATGRPVPGRGLGVRFGLLRTIQSFALTELAASGEESDARRRHALAYLALAEEAAPDLAASQGMWLDRLAIDDANLRSAMRWSIQAGDAPTALRFGAALWRFWQIDGHLAEGHDLMDAALAVPGAEAPTRERLAALAAAGGVAYWQADSGTARRYYEDQLDLARTLSDRPAEADALFNVAHTQFSEGDGAAAMTTMVQAATVYEELGDRRGLARIEWARGTLLMARGAPQAALEIFEATLIRLEELGDEPYRGMTMGSISWANLAIGDLREAFRWTVRALVQVVALRDVTSATVSLQVAAILLIDSGYPEEGAVVIGAFEALCERYGVRPPAGLDRMIRSQDPMARATGALGPAALAAALERGSRMGVQEAIDLIIAVADRVDGAQ